MDPKIAEYFARITEEANALLSDVVVTTDTTPDRSLLRLTASYGSCRIVVKEIMTVDERHYSYYILRGSSIEAGFDNSPDPEAIRLRYGRIGGEYERSYVPHLHTENKRRLQLTDKIDFFSFLEWLTKNVPRT